MKHQRVSLLALVAAWLGVVGAGLWLGGARIHADTGIGCADCIWCAQLGWVKSVYGTGATEFNSLGYKTVNEPITQTTMAFNGNLNPSPNGQYYQLYEYVASCDDGLSRTITNPAVKIASYTYDNVSPTCDFQQGQPIIPYFLEASTGTNPKFLSYTTQYYCGQGGT